MSTAERNKAHILRLVCSGALSMTEASRELALSERQLYRLKAAFVQGGDHALVHKLRGTPSNHRYPSHTRTEALDLCRRHYTDFGPTMLSEILAEQHDLVIHHETLRRWMLEAGLWQKTRKGRRHRKKRQRRSMIGDLVQFDGSHHDWFEGRAPACCLFVFVDDASNRTFMRFASSENEHAALDVLMRYIRKYGIPAEIYLDRHSVYWSEQRITQFARALTTLGCRIIYARSPQGKGRVERAHRTHQDRLIKQLRLAGISSIEEANVFLDATYLDRHNGRYAHPDGLTDVHRDATPYDLDNIICHQEERCVNHDMTIQVRSTWYQLSGRNDLLPLPRQRVVVRFWLDGSMHVFWRERELTVTAFPVRPVSAPRLVHPADDHPWRHKTPIGKAKRKTIEELCRRTP